MMEPASPKKQRPTVLITTYTSSCSYSPAKVRHFNGELGGDDEAAFEQAQTNSNLNSNTNSEKSTDLFNNVRRQLYHKAAFGKRTNIDLNQIWGPSGSIRGHRDVVRKSLENIKVVERNSSATFEGLNFINQHLSPMPRMAPNSLSLEFNNNQPAVAEMQRNEYLIKVAEDEQDLCVAYTTTLGVIRRTFEDSKAMKLILNLNLIKYEERDIFLNQEYKKQLKKRLDLISVPALFVEGQLLGGIKELEALNETGKLPILLAKFKLQKVTNELCQCCGNARFIACQNCNGSRKSKIHHFKFNSIALRCTKCDRNDGIIKCPVCSSSSSSASQDFSQHLDNNNNNNFTK